MHAGRPPARSWTNISSEPCASRFLTLWLRIGRPPRVGTFADTSGPRR